jgi:tetratricopeptide (TPR) repeat protein
MDRSTALRPLAEAAGPIRQLQEYRSDAELNAAIDAVAAAVDQSLRLALRTDPSAPEEHRMGALTPDALPSAQVVQSLRARDLISLETAGAVHELSAAADRARTARARPDDADAAARAVARLRADLAPAVEDPAPGAPAAAGSPRSGTTRPGSTRPSATRPGGPEPVTSGLQGRGRWMAWLAAGFALLMVLGLAWVLTSGGGDHYREGMAAFRAARWDSAAASFERVLQDRPVDVTTMLYLGRSYRRLGRLDRAADVLGEAVRVAPDDPDVRREIGRLYMDLGQPLRALEELERALEHDPDAVPTWAALVQALRAAGDPRADHALDRAPPEVQAALRQQR